MPTDRYAGVNRDAVVGTRPNNTGFATAGDLLDALEQASTELASLREAANHALMYVHHAPGCAYVEAMTHKPCDCGMKESEAALASLLDPSSSDTQ